MFRTAPAGEGGWSNQRIYSGKRTEVWVGIYALSGYFWQNLCDQCMNSRILRSETEGMILLLGASDANSITIQLFTGN